MKCIKQNSGTKVALTFRWPRWSFNRPNTIDIAVAESCLRILHIIVLTVVRTDVICLHRMIVEKCLEFDMKADSKECCTCLVTN